MDDIEPKHKIKNIIPFWNLTNIIHASALKRPIKLMYNVLVNV